MLVKNEWESTQLLCLYSQFPDWLIHFQELDIMLGTKGDGSFTEKIVSQVFLSDPVLVLVRIKLFYFLYAIFFET